VASQSVFSLRKSLFGWRQALVSVGKRERDKVMLVNSRMLPWQQNEIQYHINQHTPSYSVQMLQAVIISFSSLFFFLFISLIHLSHPSWLSSFQPPFLPFFSHFLSDFFLPVFIYFLIYFFLVYWGHLLFIHLVFFYFLPSCIFSLHFHKFLNKLKLHFYINKTQNIGRTEKLQLTF